MGACLQKVSAIFVGARCNDGWNYPAVGISRCVRLSIEVSLLSCWLMVGLPQGFGVEVLIL